MSSGRGMVIAAPERWAEACFAIPAIRALAKRGLAGGVVCLEEQEALWKSTTDLPLFLFSKSSRAGALAKELGSGWEASLAWETGTPAKAFSKAKIERRLGPEIKSLTKYLTHPLQVAEDPTSHRVRLYLNTAKEMGVPVDQPEYFAPAKLGIESLPGSVLLCPDSDFGVTHEWPLDRWEQLADALLKQQKKLSVAHLADGRELGQALSARLGEKAETVSIDSFSTALPLLAPYGHVIAADGSLPHLAAHTGATCTTLFGPNDANWKRPLGKRHNIVKKHVECAPCLSAKCAMDMRCQNELEVSKVVDAVLDCG